MSRAQQNGFVESMLYLILQLMQQYANLQCHIHVGGPGAKGGVLYTNAPQAQTMTTTQKY